MSTESHFGQSWGPHHSGSGNQYFLFSEMQQAVRRNQSSQDSRRIAEDSALWLKRRFVHPEGFDRARERLETSNIVLLTSARGNGTRSAAQILLWEAPHGRERYRELVDRAEEEGTGTGTKALDPCQVDEDVVLLLDLTSVPEDRFRAFMRDLPPFRATLREKRARLAVVLAPAWKELLPHELIDVVIRLGRPAVDHVLRRYLMVEGIRTGPHELNDKELRNRLVRASMGDIAGLSKEILDTREASRGNGTFGGWLRAALASTSPDAKAIEKLVRERTTAPERALLISTAFLHGATPEIVYSSAGRLLKATKSPHDHVPSLQHQPFDERLGDIKAATEKGSRRVLFQERKLAAPIRTYFWDNFPQVRSGLHTWVSETTELPAADKQVLLPLVTRYADQCLRTESPGLLIKLAVAWTGAPATSLQHLLAARILGTGAIHPRHGSHFRRWIYDCSRDTNLPTARAHVLIGVCSEALAVDFPEQAIVRLRHLSHQHDDAVSRSARAALRRITDPDDRLYGHLLKRLSTDNEETVQSDTTTFLELAAPKRHMDDAPTRSRLTELWTAALRWQDPSAWTPVFEDWLNSAAEHGTSDGRVLDVLAGTCLADSRNISTVYAAACRWAGGDTARRAVTDALWDRAKAALEPHSTTATL